MLISFLRTQIGLDEEAFLRCLFEMDVEFQNFDDTCYANFKASSLISKALRKSLSRNLSLNMARAVRAQIDRNQIETAFIFNGRGFDINVARSLHGIKKIIWFNPDFARHKEHKFLEKIATKIIYTKPVSFNDVRFIDKAVREKVININPVIFSTEEKKQKFLQLSDSQTLEQRDIEIAFLGNFSPLKANTLEEIAMMIRKPISVVGSGWKSSRWIDPLGPIYGPHLKRFFSRVKVGIAIPDSVNTIVDPITVRFFQYPVLGTLGVLSINEHNRDIFLPELKDFCFENLVEACDRINTILNFGNDAYRDALRRQSIFTAQKTPSAEQILIDWVL